MVNVVLRMVMLWLLVVSVVVSLSDSWVVFVLLVVLMSVMVVGMDIL